MTHPTVTREQTIIRAFIALGCGSADSCGDPDAENFCQDIHKPRDQQWAGESLVRELERTGYQVVPVDAVVLSRQPCNNCYKGKVCPGGERHKGVHTCTLVTCLSCGGSGSGTTWPDELITAAARKLAESSDHLKNIAQAELFDLVVDLVLDALVVQEGTSE